MMGFLRVEVYDTLNASGHSGLKEFENTHMREFQVNMAHIIALGPADQEVQGLEGVCAAELALTSGTVLVSERSYSLLLDAFSAANRIAGYLPYK